MLRRGGDDGQITVLVLGYVAIAGALVAAGIDASAVFLSRRAIAATADAAALAGAQELDRAAVYAGVAGGCGDRLPLDDTAVRRAVDAVLADDRDDLARATDTVAPVDVDVRAGTVTVRITATVRVPVAPVLARLVPRFTDGRVPVTVTAAAESPVTAPGGCSLPWPHGRRPA